jgi:hypothetical protein
MKKQFFMLMLVVTMNASAQRTPTMGWSSWNTFALNINEQLIRQQADAMHNTGLQKAGYRYVNIDDGYWDGRGEDGQLRLNTKLFPNGMRALVDYIHSLGLKAGIYSDAGDNTCGSGGQHAWGLGVGFAGHEEQDCQLYFRDWDFDFIKVDYCGGMHMRLDEQQQYTKISNAIRNCGKKDIVYNMCRWAFPGTWGADVADSWRTTGDIYDAWKSVKGILAENLYLSAYCHDGHYNDMDMLEVGRSMSQTEDETHFGMWCIMASPLLIGCNMATIHERALNLLKNEELIALNQDPLYLQAYVVQHIGETYVLVKDILNLHGTTRAVALYNPSDEEQTMSISFSDLELGGKVRVRDLFEHQDMGCMENVLTVNVPAHGTRIYRLEAEQRLVRLLYEAETAYLADYQEVVNHEQAGTAIYQPSASASGGEYVGWLGNRKSNSIEWKDVYVPKGGRYVAHFSAASQESRSFTVVLNGQPIGTITTKTNGWDDFKEYDIPLTLKPGQNSIQLFNADYWMPDIDYLRLSPSISK